MFQESFISSVFSAFSLFYKQFVNQYCFLSIEHLGEKNLFYIIESDLRCPNYKILQLQCLYVNLKMNGIVFGVDTLLKEKIIFNVNNHIQFVKFLSIVHGFNNVERFLNTVYAYVACTVIFVSAFYFICTIYLRSGAHNGFYGQFFWLAKYILLSLYNACC